MVPKFLRGPKPTSIIFVPLLPSIFSAERLQVSLQILTGPDRGILGRHGEPWLGSQEIWEPSCWLKMLSQNDAAHTGHILMFRTPSLCRWASLLYSISDHAGNSILIWGALSTHPVLKVPMWLISSDVVSGTLSFPCECSTFQKMPLYRRSMESLQLANEDSASQLAGKIWQEHNSMFYTKLTDRKKGNQPVPKKIG